MEDTTQIDINDETGVLYLIGTGLGDEYSLSLRAIQILSTSDFVFFEFYTCKSPINLINLENIIKKKITVLNRTKVEVNQEYLNLAATKKVSILIIGTPFFATTHTQILIDAQHRSIKCEIIHNSSILNVMGCFGLYSYNFGRTVSIPCFTEVKFYSFFDKIYSNYKNKLHTLCLFDLNVEKGFFMNPNQAIEQILESEDKKREDGFEKLFPEHYEFFVIKNFGCKDQMVWYTSFDDYKEIEFGDDLYSMILPAPLEVFEEEHVVEMFKK